MIAGNGNINVNNWNQYNRNVAAIAPAWGRAGNWNRPWYGNRPAWYWGRAWYNRHWFWHHGFWNYFSTPPAMWFGSGLAIGWLSSPGDTVVYENPYYAAPAAPDVNVYNYSQPIPAPAESQQAAAYPPPVDPAALEEGGSLPTTAPPSPEPDDAAKKADKLFGDARELFKAGKYAEALPKVDAAIKELPSDATLHEFRALTLFAQGKYKDAAAGLYAVLAAGPGWDWETMKILYPTEAAYTEQLRALEEFVKTNPKEGYGHFLLAYQYLVLGQKDSAVQELKEVSKLQPDDKLSAALVKALTAPPK
ncbi:MAG TPA: tetratricopeptide repeat protein [Gemmataceae bacterium]|nr:tetratricopeptide repeat protein [Gemmataceae bacterium]